jgi:hypothetical protein
LRWASYYGIEVSWNLIWGFPGETHADYAGQARLIPQLVHLPPPLGAGKIWMERFSPIFTDRSAFPVKFLRPETSYSLIYPGSVDLDRAAYFFEYEFVDGLPDDIYRDVERLVKGWQNVWKSDARPTLRMWSAPDFVQIEDDRYPERPGTHTFRDVLACLYLACSDAPINAEEARNAAAAAYPVEEVKTVLEEFVRRGLMMRDGNLFLSLAIPATGGR